MRALDRGGKLAIAGIHLSDIPTLSYEREVFQERTLTSVTANTRRDGEELLELAASRGPSRGDDVLPVRSGERRAGRPCR